MKIRIIAVGNKMPAWVESGYQEFIKRLPRDFQVEMVELAPGHRGKNADLRKAMEQEAKAIIAAIKPGEHVVALDVKGKPWSTEQLAERVAQWRQETPNVALLIGGPDGYDAQVLQSAKERWSLSNLTLPHPLVRVVLAEQLYRAWTLIQGHPYHK